MSVLALPVTVYVTVLCSPMSHSRSTVRVTRTLDTLLGVASSAPAAAGILLLQNVRRKGGSNTQLENAGIPDRNAIIFGVRQLLQMFYPGLLPSGKTTYRADQERQRVELECGSRPSLLRTKTTIHYGPNSSTLRPRKRSNHRNRRIGLCDRSNTIAAGQGETPAPGGIPLQEVPTHGN